MKAHHVVLEVRNGMSLVLNMLSRQKGWVRL